MNFGPSSERGSLLDRVLFNSAALIAVFCAISTTPASVHRYGGGSPAFASPPGTYPNLRPAARYSMKRVGISGRGRSFSVESSKSGLPHRYTSNSASFVTEAGTLVPSALLAVGDLERKKMAAITPTSEKASGQSPRWADTPPERLRSHTLHTVPALLVVDREINRDLGFDLGGKVLRLGWLEFGMSDNFDRRRQQFWRPADLP